MKRCVLLLGSVVLLLALAGCQAQVQWETVDDEAVSVSAPASEPYVITFGVPEGTSKQEISNSHQTLYVQKDGDFEILSDVLVASSLDDAVRQVSGFGADELTLVETDQSGMTKYQFAWASSGDEGGYVSRAAMVEDLGYYYVLVFSTREEVGNAYDDCAEAVFSSFGLQGGKLY